MQNIEQRITKILEVCEHILHIGRENLSISKKILDQLVPPPAVALKIDWDKPSETTVRAPEKLQLFKENSQMSVSLNPGQTRGFTFSPINAQGGASSATLSNPTFATSDSTVFTVSADPNAPNSRGIVTALTPAITPDAAVLTVTATATEPDGVTTETISGTDTVTVVTVAPPPPPPPVAASLQITWDAASAQHKK